MAEEKDTSKEEEVKEEPVEEKEPEKQEEKKETPKPKKKQAPKKKPTPQPMVHIDDFLEAVAGLVDLTPMQQAGFKANMQGKVYQKDYDAFGKHLEEYLGS